MTGRNQSASDVAPVRERDVGNQGEPSWGPNPEPCSHLGLERGEEGKRRSRYTGTPGEIDTREVYWLKVYHLSAPLRSCSKHSGAKEEGFYCEFPQLVIVICLDLYSSLISMNYIFY